MEKKFSLSKIFNSKVFKIIVVIFIILGAISALGASTYVSFKKEKKRQEIQLKKQIAKAKAEEPKPIVIDRTKFKTVTLNNVDVGRMNPFIPVKNNEVPTEGLSGDTLLTPPPLGDVEESDAQMAMGTTVSGIMYDSYNPSAIINIDGIEYFVKKNDIINKYKILSISPKSVVVKVGNNVYSAGVGELFTSVESNSHIVNLDKKFGGSINDNIPINIRKR
jgi:hypothetical protein